MRAGVEYPGRVVKIQTHTTNHTDAFPELTRMESPEVWLSFAAGLPKCQFAPPREHGKALQSASKYGIFMQRAHRSCKSFLFAFHAHLGDQKTIDGI
jgi:hypothetical protein